MFICKCEIGFEGETCENNLNECQPNPCKNDGTCTDGLNVFSCSCPDGFDGNTCDSNVNECASNPCENRGSCVDEVNSYTCSCVFGHTGTYCQTKSLAGIKIVNKENMLVVEEGQVVNIELQLTVPFICLDNSSSCVLQIEVQTLDVINLEQMCANDLQTTRNIAFIKNDPSPQPCTYNIDVKEQGSIFKIPITGYRNGVYNDPRDEHPLRIKLKTPQIIKHAPDWENYDIGEIQINVLDRDHNSAGIQCSSNTDPHICTFDKSCFEFHKEGEYTLYKTEKWPIQVNVFFVKCNSYATCNCGVAVQSGNDVIVFDKCKDSINGLTDTKPFEIRTYGCESLGKGLKILETISGYHVLLPNGATVIVQTGTTDFLRKWFNVQISPSSQDFNTTSGICGRWDGNQTVEVYEDFQRWRVLQNKSLYNGIPRPLTANEDDKIDDMLYCDCRNKQPICSHENYKLCESISDISDVLRNKCQEKKTTSSVRSKRDVNGDGQRIFLPTGEEISPLPQVWPLGINESVAEATCLVETTKTEAGDFCNGLQNLGLTSLQAVDQCKLDAKYSGGFSWSASTYAAYVDGCRWDSLQNFTLFSDDGGNRSSSFDVFCPENCTLHGRCNFGLCQCDDGFSGEDCSRPNTDPPQVDALDDDGLCNSMENSCQSVTVFGDYFINLDTLSCHLTPVKVQNQSFENMGQTEIHRTVYEYIARVECKIPTLPLEGDTETYNEGYLVTVSNDGSNTGREHLFVKYNPACEECNSKNRTCTKRTDVCTIGKTCYEHGDIAPDLAHDCFTCDIWNSKQNWFCKDTKECREKVKKEEIECNVRVISHTFRYNQQWRDAYSDITSMESEEFLLTRKKHLVQLLAEARGFQGLYFVQLSAGSVMAKGEIIFDKNGDIDALNAILKDFDGKYDGNDGPNIAPAVIVPTVIVPAVIGCILAIVLVIAVVIVVIRRKKIRHDPESLPSKNILEGQPLAEYDAGNISKGKTTPQNILEGEPLDIDTERCILPRTAKEGEHAGNSIEDEPIRERGRRNKNKEELLSIDWEAFNGLPSLRQRDDPKGSLRGYPFSPQMLMGAKAATSGTGGWGVKDVSTDKICHAFPSNTGLFGRQNIGTGALRNGQKNALHNYVPRSTDLLDDL